MSITKQCIDCPPGFLKDASEFWVSRTNRRKDGLMPTCKDCTKARRRTYIARTGKESRYNHIRYLRVTGRADPTTHGTEDPMMQARRHTSARRARQRNQFIEDVDPQIVYQMHGGMCGICKEFIEGDFHVDHVVPLSKGGMHGYVNVQPAHPTCNHRKGARWQ